MPHWDARKWSTVVWTVGVVTVGGAWVLYARWSECNTNTDPTRLALCNDTSGSQVTTWAIGLVIVVWLLGLATIALAFAIARWVRR